MLQNDTIKIVIAFDEQLVAEGLQAVLSNQNNISVIGLLKNDENIINLIPQLNPDIIILEFLMWHSKYLEFFVRLKATFPKMGILIISELVSQDKIKDLMPYINGYVLRTCSSDKVILAISEIFKSGKYLCPKALDEYFNCSGTVKNDSPLTIREREVLCSWIEAKDNDEIADNLNISRSTVRTHMNNIRQKLGSLNHLQLMIYACKQNIMNRNFKPICPNCRAFCN